MNIQELKLKEVEQIFPVIWQFLIFPYTWV